MLNPYSLDANGNGDDFAPFNRNGAQVEASYFPIAHFGLTYEMSFFTTGDRIYPGSSPGETVSIRTQRYMIGPAFRYTLHGGTSRFTLFAHQLFGSSRNSLTDNQYTENNFTNYSMTLVSGGGLDFRISRHFAVRPAEMEYQTEQITPDFFIGPGSGQSLKFGVDGFNYTAGAAYNF